MTLLRRLVQAFISSWATPRLSGSIQTKRSQNKSSFKKEGYRKPYRANHRKDGRKHIQLKRWSFQGHSKKTIIAYHGTPSLENAKSIVRHGWIVGSGNANGDGVYLADLATAKSYAGATGAYLKCHVAGKTCQWTPTMQTKYSAWCQSRGVRQDNSAKTAFLIQQGFGILQTGNVIVTLAPQMANPTAWKRKDRRIRIMGIYRASDDHRILV